MRNIIIRPLAFHDLKTLHTWVNYEFVSQWYEKRKFTYDDVEKKYGARITGKEPVNAYMVLDDQTPMAYAQWYMIHDYPSYAACLDVSIYTAGIDVFIGDPDYLGKGLGAEIISQFVRDIVFTKPGIDRVVTGPHPDHTYAIKAYEKAGFEYIKTITNDEGDPEHLLMRRKKSDNVLFEHTS